PAGGVAERVQLVAVEWSRYANIHFAFDDAPDAQIRISFKDGAGSWSTVGVDAKDVPQGEATMNYGWLEADTDPEEYQRVVLHEFGHAIGFSHEHQNPAVGIKWNKAAVYAMYAGEPNHWDGATVDLNIFKTYSKTETNYSKFDRESIMLYAIP